MQLFYNAANTNFGDHINAWLWPRLIPGILEDHPDRTLVGIGSLLKADLDRVPGQKVIFGTGSGYGPPPINSVADRWEVYGVRGPLTAKMFGLPDAAAITDGAWLIDQLPEYRDPGARTGEVMGEVVFIPHWSSAEMGSWQAPCGAAGLRYVDPLDDGPSVLRRIATARLAIVESLHGAIFADYFRTPWIAVNSSDRILHYKWVDWCASLDMSYRSHELPPSDYVDFLLQGRRPSTAPPSPEPRAFDAQMFRYQPVAERTGAGPGYRALTRAKAVARRGRKAMFDCLRRHRHTRLLEAWNTAHRDRLAGHLVQLSGLEGQLSRDEVRRDRLDRLAEALHRFRRNFG